jgi:hypothetical protein
MATLNQVRTRVDNWLAEKWPSLVARQDNFFINRGRYWQGLRTHTIVPAHTNGADGDSLCTELDAQPNDAFSNWRNAFPEWATEPIPCALQCDVYDGPLGKGWFATIWIRYNGTLYKRSRNVGPESEHTQAWAVVTEGPI